MSLNLGYNTKWKSNWPKITAVGRDVWEFGEMWKRARATIRKRRRVYGPAIGGYMSNMITSNRAKFSFVPIIRCRNNCRERAMQFLSTSFPFRKSRSGKCNTGQDSKCRGRERSRKCSSTLHPALMERAILILCATILRMRTNSCWI